MPRNIINEDHWIQLMLEMRINNETIVQHWGYCQDAVVLFQPSNLFDFYRQSKRIIKGDLQLQRSFPDLGFERSYVKEVKRGATEAKSIKARLERKMQLLTKLPSPMDRILVIPISLYRQFAMKTLYTLARWQARRDFVHNFEEWGTSKSSKEVVRMELPHSAPSPPIRQRDENG
jgi:hypothetical protein